jgi:hypothetical protein
MSQSYSELIPDRTSAPISAGDCSKDTTNMPFASQEQNKKTDSTAAPSANEGAAVAGLTAEEDKDLRDKY